MFAFCFSFIDKCRIGHFTKFATIERKLNRIIHFLENGNEVRNEIPENDFSLLPNFLLTTVEQVEMFNNQLEDINVRRQFVSILLFTNIYSYSGLTLITLISHLQYVLTGNMHFNFYVILSIIMYSLNICVYVYCKFSKFQQQFIN